MNDRSPQGKIDLASRISGSYDHPELSENACVAKTVFQRNQKVWVESVGAWATIEKIVPVWAKGFEAASTDNLLAAMKIGRQSLYDTFGDKRRLYLEALGRYQAVNLANQLAQLDAAVSRQGMILSGAPGGSCTKPPWADWAQARDA